MENQGKYAGDPRQLSPASLAFIGDGVFELLVRERLLEKGSLPAHKLHRMAVERVRATAQAKAFEALEEVCTPEELDILRRGRNASTARVPKSCTPEDYRKATAVETLFGYLYLSGGLARIGELYETVRQVFGE